MITIESEMKTGARLYIAGKITGLTDLNMPKFEQAEYLLALHGYTPVNPLKLNHSANITQCWMQHMKVCIKALLDCDAIALLDDWHNSKGASLEFKIACELEMPYLILGKDAKTIIRTINLN